MGLKSGINRQRRRANQLSLTRKRVSSRQSLRHLADSEQRRIDRTKSQAWQAEARHRKELEKANKASLELIWCDLPPVSRQAVTSAVLARNADCASRDLVFNFAGSAENFREEAGEDFVQRMLLEHADRRHFITECRHHRQTPGEITDQYVRSAPWIASFDWPRATVMAAAIATAKAFEEKTGFDFLGGNIHREKFEDLHLHLNYTKVKKVFVEEPISRRAQRRLDKEERARIKEELKKRKLEDPSVDCSPKAVKAEFERQQLAKSPVSGLDETKNAIEADLAASRRVQGDQFDEPRLRTERFVENRKVQAKEGCCMELLGSAFRMKYHLCCIPGLSPELREQVAATYDRPEASFSFRKWLRGELPDRKPMAEHMDVWLEQTFMAELVKTMPEAWRKEAQEKAIAYAKDYVERGNANPLPSVLKEHIRELETKVKVLQQGPGTAESPERARRLEAELKATQRRSVSGSSGQSCPLSDSSASSYCF
jgi:hypothetical protein